MQNLTNSINLTRPDHNVRAAAQWVILKDWVKFRKKKVIDIGCGYADLATYIAYYGGPEYVHGVEKNYDIYLAANLRGKELRDQGFDLDNLIVTNDDADDFNDKYPTSCDIAICFAVLPYFRSPYKVLRWMLNHSKIALIEFQYAADGPYGNPDITDTQAAIDWLSSIGWEKVEKIGDTPVQERSLNRDILMCR